MNSIPSGRLARVPVLRLSKAMTCSPLLTKAPARWLPMKPAPPVMRMRLVIGDGFYVRQNRVVPGHKGFVIAAPRVVTHQQPFEPDNEQGVQVAAALFLKQKR